MNDHGRMTYISFSDWKSVVIFIAIINYKTLSQASDLFSHWRHIKLKTSYKNDGVNLYIVD